MDNIFNQPSEKIKLEFIGFNPNNFLGSEQIARLIRSKKLASYQITDNKPIKICANCGKSKLKVKKSTRTDLIWTFVNQCSDCKGPAVQFKAKIESVNWFGRPEFSGYCSCCEEAKTSEELEYDRDTLVRYEKKEIEVDVVQRSIVLNKIDMHHLQYDRGPDSDLDDHGREVKIPLCKKCHQQQQDGELPCFDPEKIHPEENILSPVFGSNKLNPRNLEIDISPVDSQKDL